MTCGDGGERRRARSLMITNVDPMQALYRENFELREQTNNLEGNRVQELVTAFSGGALSLVLVFVVVRVSQAATRSVSSTRSRGVVQQRYSQTPQDERGLLHAHALEIDGPDEALS